MREANRRARACRSDRGGKVSDGYLKEIRESLGENMHRAQIESSDRSEKFSNHRDSCRRAFHIASDSIILEIP